MRNKFRGGLLATAFVFVASTCGMIVPSAVAPTSAGAATQVPLNLANEQGELWSCAFNPFVPTSSPYSVGLTYETLDFVNSLQSGKVTPWLATKYAWSNNNKTLTFTIRPGVKWSDGKPFSAADVAYTFNLLKKYPALDTNAVWSVLSKVSRKGSNQVVFNFSTPAAPFFYYIADQVPIVPEHIWSKIKNPITDPITNPVGTGGYIMSHCTPQNIQWTANPHYWQKGKAVVKTVNMPAFLSNNTCNEYLATGQSQWGSQFIPNIKSYYVDKKPGNTYWFAPVANVSLFPNLKVKPLNNVAVREAISYGIDRASVSKKGEYGYEPPASQVGIVSPTFSSWVSSAAKKAVGSSYNVKKAKAVLKAAGYKMGSDGFFEKNGKKLALTVITNGGYSDWVASMQVVSQQLAKVGIDLTVETPSANTFYADVYAGKFQLAYNVESGGPTPFYEMRQWLYSKNSAPIGQAAASNWERYSNPGVDKLLNSYFTTTNVATQHSIVAKLEHVMVTQYPVIPVLEEVDWFQYNSKEFTGYPTAAHPYAQAGLYNEPDWGYVLDNLKPLK
ncbi:MAG: ABC transporter substrate-binding protein [Acidimicrobiales bacterium]